MADNVEEHAGRVDAIYIDRLEPATVRVARGADDTFFAIIGDNLDRVLDMPKDGSYIFGLIIRDDDSREEVAGLRISIDSTPSPRRINAIVNASSTIPDHYAGKPLLVGIKLKYAFQDAEGTLIIL